MILSILLESEIMQTEHDLLNFLVLMHLYYAGGLWKVAKGHILMYFELNKYE